ncbi:hypothetical protein JOC24_000168 [Streptomyces sp. HB132]|nr:hypothetical protein [Streptomyces sp. HB132]
MSRIGGAAGCPAHSVPSPPTLCAGSDRGLTAHISSRARWEPKRPGRVGSRKEGHRPNVSTWRRTVAPPHRTHPRDPVGRRPAPRPTRLSIRIGPRVTVVTTLLVLGVKYLPEGVQATRDHIAKCVPVGVRGVSQDGEGNWIEARLDRSTRVLDVRTTPGLSKRPVPIGEASLPRRVESTITLDGSTAPRRLARTRARAACDAHSATARPSGRGSPSSRRTPRPRTSGGHRRGRVLRSVRRGPDLTLPRTGHRT